MNNSPHNINEIWSLFYLGDKGFTKDNYIPVMTLSLR